MKQKAGLTTPKKNADRQGGFDIEPGSDDEATDDEEELDDLQGKPSPIVEPEPEETSEAEEDPQVDKLTEKFKELSSKQSKDNLHFGMKGYFVQDEVPDPDDPLLKRQRVCVFSTLASGMSMNRIEASREQGSHTVTFTGHLADEAADAETLLGHIADGDDKMVRGLQTVIDKQLDTNRGEFRGIVEDVEVTIPKEFDLEKDFVDPLPIDSHTILSWSMSLKQPTLTFNPTHTLLHASSW